MNGAASVRRNALLNFAGYATPLASALFLVPPLVSRLGAERFGFLAIAWVLVGYFSLFDLGLGRTLARMVAERRGTETEWQLPALSGTALVLTMALGVAAGAVLFVISAPLCTRFLRFSGALQEEAVAAMQVLALSLPLVTTTAALRGMLEAGGRFDWVNAIRVPLGFLTFAAPLASTRLSANLVVLSIALVLVRLAAFAAHWAVSRHLYPELTVLARPRRAALATMLGYGAWLTVSNVVGPLMVYIDRFLIGVVVAVSAVTYYSAPYEVVTRLWLVPAALTAVLFPLMARAQGPEANILYRKGIIATCASVMPLAALLVAFAPQWLEAWLGGEFARQGSRVAQLLSVGAAINCLAYLPFTLLQARGRADWTAKTHLVELPIYLGLLWICLQRWGVEGAALAWMLRCAADAGILFLLARRLLLSK